MAFSRSLCLMRSAITITLLSISAVIRTANAAAGFEKDVLPYLEEHCLKCHDADVQKGDFTFSITH